MAPRRRRVRPLGGGEPATAALVDGRRARRLLGVRRAQVAERPLRLRLRVLCAPGRPCRGDGVRASYLGPGRGTDASAAATSCRSRRGAPAASRPGRRSARSAARASPISSTAAARWPAGSPTRLDALDGVEVVNDVVLNQVLVRVGDEVAHRIVSSSACRRRDVLARRDDLARGAAHADLGLELVDDRSRRRPQHRGDLRGRARPPWRRRPSVRRAGRRGAPRRARRSPSPAVRGLPPACAGWVVREPGAVAPRVRRPDGCGRNPPPQFGHTFVQDLLDTGRSRTCIRRSRSAPRRIRRQVAVAELAVRAQLEHRREPTEPAPGR